MAGSWRLTAPLYTEDGWTPTTVPFLQASILFLTLVYVFETYLDFRQHQKLKEAAFPRALADAIGALDAAKKQSQTNAVSANDSEDSTSDGEVETEPSSMSLLETTLKEFDESRAYGLDQSTLKFFSRAYTHAMDAGLLLLGYLSFLWSVSGHAVSALGLDPTNEIYRSVMFFALNMLQNILSDLPVELHAAFVVEACHGFNNQSLGFFLTDQVKKILLLMAMGCPLTAGLVYLV